MKIREKFLQLTSKTYPHGSEREVFQLLGVELIEDEFGNLYKQIGQSDVMFTSHLDTATSAKTQVNHVIEGNMIKTDGTSILGADDKAGVTIMLWMIENNIPGLYYFFLGEEVGCIGSKKLADRCKKNKIEGISKVVSFDRRGTDSVITFQSGFRCCSDEFGEALATALNSVDTGFKYKTDPTGILTDSIQFVDIYPECTNISVGYRNEHTFSECQDISHLESLAQAVLSIDWNSLPVKRDPSERESRYSMSNTYDYYGYGSYESCSLYDARYDGFDEDRPFSILDKEDKIESVWFFDEDFKYVSKIDRINSKIVSVDFSEERIEQESKKIEGFLSSINLEYKTFKWDGCKLKVTYDFNHSTECDRSDILEYLPELDYFISESLINEI